jgi:integrase
MAGGSCRSKYSASNSTGCRKGEALGLKWQDIDFEGRRIVIRRKAQAHGVRPLRLHDARHHADSWLMPISA